MAKRFRGTSTHKVDSKGRVSIPAPFRRVLEEGDPDYADGLQPQVVLVYGRKQRDFIEGYTLTEMEEVEDKIAAMPRASRERRLLENIYLSQSQQIGIDNTGRLVLSQDLRDKFEIGAEAEFVGSGSTFQIWEPSKYAGYTAALDALYDDEDDDFDPMTLLDRTVAE